MLEKAQKMPEPTLVFDGRYFPDKVARCLMLSERLGDVENHLVPVEEQHLTYGRACSCEPSQTVWQGQRVVYHQTEIIRVTVPQSMPEEI